MTVEAILRQFSSASVHDELLSFEHLPFRQNAVGSVFQEIGSIVPGTQNHQRWTSSTGEEPESCDEGTKFKERELAAFLHQSAHLLQQVPSKHSNDARSVVRPSEEQLPLAMVIEAATVLRTF